MENDDQCQKAQFHRPAQQEVEGVEVTLVSQPHGHHDEQHRPGHLGGIGPPEEADKLIEQEGQDGDVHQV